LTSELDGFGDRLAGNDHGAVEDFLGGDPKVKDLSPGLWKIGICK
jgi:hypothetical protein